MTWLVLGKGAVNGRVPLPPDQRVEGGPVALTKSFPFNAYSGGEKGAINAAKSWRDYHAKKVYGADWQLRITQARNHPRAKADSGILDEESGVTYVKLGNAWTWRATWQTGPPYDRKPQVKTFAVGVHGYERAHKMAIQARQEGVEKDLLDLARQVWVLPPDSPLLQNLPREIRRREYKSGAQVWEVRGLYRGAKPMVRGFFPDAEFDNNPKKSLVAAAKFFAEEKNRLVAEGIFAVDENGAVIRTDSKRQPRRHKGRQSSGIRRRKEPGLDGGFYWHWAVLWQENGRSRKKRFSDGNYADSWGKPASWWAFIEAVAYRRDRELEIYGDTRIPETTPELRKIYKELMKAAEAAS